MQRINITTGSKWEQEIGYSRAVKIGNIIEVTGTVAVDGSGEIVGLGNMYLQSKFIFLKIEGVLKQLGANMSDVIRTRVFTTDISKWEEIGKAHSEFFANVRPALTMVEVNKLIGPDYLVEIEISAYIDESVARI